ncbi:ankyrin repeat domain-containing protein [uncultured Helicobacter sp.]|uniref:ankyrin repeat domain-containing protein n=1 Tax=uncultured Helicobacter sp. TaxID=175537 RepID=UPI00262B254F|nr:ankyrin repeat domain-containing protein [uncultured Helicobacter sp.]
MKHCTLKIILCLGVVISCYGANDRYNYLLFSNNYTDVRKGINLGADIGARLRGSTPLYDAARKGNLEILYLLIERGADVNAVSHGETALLKVVALNNYKFAKALIDKGAKVNVADEHLGNTPLHYAVIKKNTEMIKLLLSKGANMYSENFKGDTPARYILASHSLPAVSIKNADITLDASSFNLGNGNVNITIKNESEKVVNIQYVALYINGDLISELEVSKRIPPNVSAAVTSLKIPSTTYEHIRLKKSGTTDIKYGFAVEYDIEGKKKNLYKKTNAELTLW